MGPSYLQYLYSKKTFWGVKKKNPKTSFNKKQTNICILSKKLEQWKHYDKTDYWCFEKVYLFWSKENTMLVLDDVSIHKIKEVKYK